MPRTSMIASTWARPTHRKRPLTNRGRCPPSSTTASFGTASRSTWLAGRRSWFFVRKRRR
eukprot:8879561-Lingulodinium_polyedra.AAC.1